MIDSGDLDAAIRSIDKAIESNTLESYDPRIQRLSERIKDAKASPTNEPTVTQAPGVPGLSKEYALATPAPEAPPAPEKPHHSRSQASKLSYSQQVCFRD